MGMVPSSSKGWCFSGDMKSSIAMKADEPPMINKGSKYLNLEVGNQIGAV